MKIEHAHSLDDVALATSLKNAAGTEREATAALIVLLA
jgi:hypothetical protein